MMELHDARRHRAQSPHDDRNAAYAVADIGRLIDNSSTLMDAAYAAVVHPAHCGCPESCAHIQLQLGLGKEGSGNGS